MRYLPTISVADSVIIRRVFVTSFVDNAGFICTCDGFSNYSESFVTVCPTLTIVVLYVCGWGPVILTDSVCLSGKEKSQLVMVRRVRYLLQIEQP